MGPMVLPSPVDQTRDSTLATRTLAGMWQGIKLLRRFRQMKKRGKPILSYGGSLQGRMLMLADKAGIDMRTSTGVVELAEEDGRITGVVAEHDGKQLRVQARDGVL